ncbi:hypothetical protein [Flavobacterium sp. KBS0721]|uniref:hypothetical protein n=1 Tax=Flavobacterium sp. KBS0721 TaxID=1179672 RepID=UPI00098EBBAA|nr:hypothetical protein [Flavobacterium sp. KBS0721]QDW22423.1 hypothetical protein B0M43_0020615 [Flavobacterium sp. KBS0721]
MKKLIYLLLLIQSGFMIAQTETMVTVNGKKVSINPNTLNTANNGLTSESGNIQLGGPLMKASTITTTPDFTLAIVGLQAGTNADEIVVTDANGVLKTVPKTSFTGDNLGNHTAAQNLEMSNKDILNIKNAYIKNDVQFSDRNTANTKYFGLYKNAGVFGIWNSNKSVNALSIDETTNNTAFASTISFPDANASKILFLNNNNAARIELTEDWNFGLVAGSTTTANSGQFSWSNYSGTSGAQKELMRLNSTGLGIGTTAPTAALHVKSAADPLRLEGLVESTDPSNIALVIGTDGVVKKSLFPQTYAVPSIAPGESYIVTLNANITVATFIVATQNSCDKNAIASFQTYNNVISFLGGQGGNILYTATVTNNDGYAQKLVANGTANCEDGGDGSQFNFSIAKSGSTITITNNGNVERTYTIIQNGM